MSEYRSLNAATRCVPEVIFHGQTVRQSMGNATYSGWALKPTSSPLKEISSFERPFTSGGDRQHKLPNTTFAVLGDFIES